MRTTIIGVIFTITALFGADRFAGPAVIHGTIVVGGNDIGHVDSLVADNGRVFAGDFQVWPAIPRDSLNGISAEPETADQISIQKDRLISDIRAELRRPQPAGPPLSWGGRFKAALKQRRSSLVDSVWVNPQDGVPWVKWHGSFAEEVLPDHCVVMLEDPAVSQARLWNQLLDRGCTIYTGDGYTIIVPSKRAAEHEALLQRAVAEGVSAQVVAKRFSDLNAELIRDLRDPQPLSVLKRR